MAHVVVMAHGTRLLTTALYADDYLSVQIKGTVGELNLLESQLAATEVAARRGRRLDEGAHIISFRPTCFGTREWDAQKGPG
jgi:hypothetical protein